MIQIENLPIVLTGIGIIVSILYHTSVLKNTSKSRQIQIISSIPTQTNWGWMDWRYKDFNQFMSDYGPEVNPDVWALSFCGLIDLKHLASMLEKVCWIFDWFVF
jgi:hypothetical protein